MRRQSNEMHIMRIVHFIRPVGSELEVNVFLPESEAHDYLKVVAGSAVEGRVTLLRYMQYESGVWDLL
ncbi:hypothetical protein [Thermogymnomonas acidicola]|nr:hypothetical protein [Thermogymnomonas acidicola]